MTSFMEDYVLFKAAWKNQSINKLKIFISKDLSAREITGTQIEDYGYDTSIEGWKQAFEYFKTQDAEWVLTEMGCIPLRQHEVMAVSHATLRIDGKLMQTANLFFHTFQKTTNGNWEIIRSYVEAAIPRDSIEQHRLEFK